MASNPTSTLGKSAAQKEAEASLHQADVAGLEAQQLRTQQQSRGSFSRRALRVSGTDLAGYLIGGYRDDPLPKPPKPTGGSSARAPKPPAKPRARAPSKPKAPKLKPVSHKKAVKKQTRMSDARGDSLDAARRRALAARRATQRSNAKKATATAKSNYAKATARKKVIAPSGKAPKAV